VVELFPVGRRLAFDPEKGRLWVICGSCARWNLSPIEERWEAIDDCERRFRATHLRFSTDNIGLAQLREGLDLVRIGKALRPEVAAWRYGDVIQRRGSGRLIGVVTGLARRGVRAASDAIGRITRDDTPSIFADEPLTRLRLYRHRDRVLEVLTDDQGNRSIIRWGHLDAAELIRPDPHEPWRLTVKHDHGLTTVRGDDGVRTAAKILAALNAAGALPDDVRRATAKIEDAEDEEGYFSRIVALAMRTGWGRFPDAPMTRSRWFRRPRRSDWRYTSRIGRLGWLDHSEPSTLMLHLPAGRSARARDGGQRDTERRALAGELIELERVEGGRRDRGHRDGMLAGRSSRSSARNTPLASSPARAGRAPEILTRSGVRACAISPRIS
jgi:hypothetical protein